MRTMPWGGGRKTKGVSSGSCRNTAAKESDVAVVEAPAEVPVAWVPSFALGELGSGVDERNVEGLDEGERSGESWICTPRGSAPCDWVSQRGP